MKTLTLFAFTGIIFLGILLNSCKHEPILPPGPDVSFKNDIQKTISTKCTFACHKGNGEEPLLLEYNDIFPRYVTIYKPLESKLYKVETPELIWYGQSRSYTKDPTPSLINAFSKMVISDIRKNKLLVK